MTRNTNFVNMSVAVLGGKSDNAMSARSNHSLAVVKASENYDVLQESFRPHLRTSTTSTK